MKIRRVYIFVLMLEPFDGSVWLYLQKVQGGCFSDWKQR